MGKLREFIEEALAGGFASRKFKIGRTKGSISFGILGQGFRIRFDIETKKGRRIMMEFADLFDQIEGMEWIEEHEVKTRQWNEKANLTKNEIDSVTPEMEDRMKKFIRINGARILNHRIAATKYKARCKICDRIIGKSEERVYVCDAWSKSRFISCETCYGLLRKFLAERELDPLTDEEFHSLMERYAYLKRDDFEAPFIHTDGGGSLRVGTSYDDVLFSDKPREEALIATEAESVLLAVMNLKPGTNAIIYNDNTSLVTLLSLFVKKNRKYEALYSLIKSLEVRKGLKLQYQHMSDPITHSTHTVG